MTTEMIGGELCKQPLASRLLPADPRKLNRAEIDGLWRIFVAIGKTWKNTVHDSAGLKSSWLEFVNEKTRRRPSFVAEYVNALEVVQELIDLYSEDAAFRKLFFDHGIPAGSLTTRLAHAKNFVVNEFIRVQIIAGGFKMFADPKNKPIVDSIDNRNGFIGGSRYNRIQPVRRSSGAEK